MNTELIHTPNVAAIFVTMNRCNTARICIEKLVNQIRKPNKIYVFNNASTDHTQLMLDEVCSSHLGYVSSVYSKENLGNAGGIEAAMDLAFKEGADAVWILDDDSFPRPTALQVLLEGYDSQVVRHPLQFNPETSQLTWPVILRLPGGKRSLVWRECDMGNHELLESEAAWTGALISREIFDKVGPVKGDLFIRGEDEEYPWRIAKAGFRFELVRNAVLDHVGPKNMIHWQAIDKNFVVERALSDWKLYYKIRNMVWLKKQQFGAPKAISMAFAYALAVAWVDSPRRLPLVFHAALDGWRGKLGKWQHHPA